MMRAALKYSVGLFLLLAGSALAERSEFAVTYVSADHIYVDGGREDGLNIGDRLGVVVGGDSVVLEVVFVAGHSGSCRPIMGSLQLKVGDKLFVLRQALRQGASDTTAAPLATSVEPPAPAAEIPRAHTVAHPTRVTGSFGIGYYHWGDGSPAALDFTQTNARLSVKARHLWRENVTLAIRSRGRYDDRARSYGAVGRNAWENRLWELSLSYDNPTGRLSATAGRLLPRRLPVVGYIDGGMVELRLTESSRLGLLGGQQPEWWYRTEDFSITRLGGYLHYASPNRGGLAFSQTLGGIGEYHSGTINRSFLASQGQLQIGRSWGISHSAEIDINTGWRKDRAGESASLSRVFVNTWWRAHSALRLSVSYDNLKRYWTYEYYSLADSLFDDRTRTGWRTRMDWSPTSTWNLSAGGGYRSRPDDEDPTLTYSFSVRRSSLGYRWLSASAYFSGFNGAFERGANYAARLQAQLPGAGFWHCGYGAYRYTVDKLDESRSSWWLEIGIDTDIARHYYLGGQVQFNQGDDIDGWRLNTELGYRF